MLNYLLVLLALILIYLIYTRPYHTNMVGGSREAIFSRFNYQPDFPMISQFDQVNLDRASKQYNVADPVKFIMGRPYRYYHTPDSTWLYPWHFPQPINKPAIQKAMDRCQEPIVMIKQEEDKLGGLGVATPKDIVRVSPCFWDKYSSFDQIWNIFNRID